MKWTLQICWGIRCSVVSRNVRFVRRSVPSPRNPTSVPTSRHSTFRSVSEVFMVPIGSYTRTLSFPQLLITYLIILPTDSKTILNDMTTTRTYYPNWDIPPEKSLETSLYWKWFMVKFNDRLARNYNLKPADIPTEWRSINWKKAKDSLAE